ncbi:MAG: energy-coupling factor transporter transmembrane protein EcfT [Lachnospiraceae bacterium]|nr:energy-coupling factor transporter transmembrane protein EcfT [Lachnospiraceae bacterium]
MLREMTIGQYYQAESRLHRLDPRVKLVGTLIFIISLFISQKVSCYVAATVFLICMIRLSRVPFLHMIKGMKAIAFIMLITVFFNLVFTPGEELVSFWVFKITSQGVRNAIFTAVRLTYLILGSSLMTLTTTPNDLTDGLEKGLGFMKVFKLPVHEIAMMMSIALRFIPILLEETDKIMKAQQARGADFESGGMIRRVRAMVPLLVPLFVSAFRRANDLALAMEARCYHGGEGRTKMKPLKYKPWDFRAYVILFCYIALVVLFGIISPL